VGNPVPRAVTRISSGLSSSVFGKYVGSLFIDAFSVTSCADDVDSRMLAETKRANTTAPTNADSFTMVLTGNVEFIGSSPFDLLSVG
jgi:hypothetical protein